MTVWLSTNQSRRRWYWLLVNGPVSWALSEQFCVRSALILLAWTLTYPVQWSHHSHLTQKLHQTQSVDKTPTCRPAQVNHSVSGLKTNVHVFNQWVWTKDEHYFTSVSFSGCFSTHILGIWIWERVKLSWKPSVPRVWSDNVLTTALQSVL